jgi:hypothetical protein
MKTIALYGAIPLLVIAAFALFPDRTVGVTSLVVCTAMWWVFCIWYAIRSKWWRNKYSRNLMAVGFGIAAVLSTFLSVVFFGRYPGYLIVYTLVFTNLAALGAQRIYYMEQVQRGSVDAAGTPTPRRRSTDYVAH